MTQENFEKAQELGGRRKMISFDEFRDEVVFYATNNRPKDWRYGQAVFNFIDEEYGVARYVQFEDGVDCFYNDDVVDEFILHAYVKLQNLTKKQKEEEKNAI